MAGQLSLLAAPARVPPAWRGGPGGIRTLSSHFVRGVCCPLTPRAHRRRDRNVSSCEGKFEKSGMNTPRFAHLSARTTYSLREGAIRPEELAAATRKLGMNAVAITDTN